MKLDKWLISRSNFIKLLENTLQTAGVQTKKNLWNIVDLRTFIATLSSRFSLLPPVTQLQETWETSHLQNSQPNNLRNLKFQVYSALLTPVTQLRESWETRQQIMTASNVGTNGTIYCCSVLHTMYYIVPTQFSQILQLLRVFVASFP
jgi:hypothetical protein